MVTSEKYHELVYRVLSLESDIKRHEQIATVIFAVLVAFGLLSLPTISAYLRLVFQKRLAPLLTRSKTTLDETSQRLEQKLGELAKEADAAKAVVDFMRKQAGEAAGDSGYMIQLGSCEAAFGNSNYKSGVIVFEKEFPVMPQILVGEARPGAWLIVKVDEKSPKQFTWAALNTSGNQGYTTEIQWIAVARIAKEEIAGRVGPTIAARRPEAKEPESQ